MFNRTASIGFVALLAALSVGQSRAQTGVPGTPASITSSDTVQSYDARQLELMRVREAAQRARASAQQAAMARSAERALEEQYLQGSVDRSLEVKQLKAQAAEDARTQTAASAYKGVSSADIQSWDGANTGPVTVRPDVPQQFTDTIVSDDDESEKKGFMSGVFGWRPGFVGRKKREAKAKAETNPELPVFAPAETLRLESAPPPVAAPVVEEKKKGGLKIPLIGGLFKGGRDEEEVEVAVDPYFAQPPAAPAPAYTAPPASSSASMAAAGAQPLVPAPDPFPGSDSTYAAAPSQEIEEEKEGFFGRLNPFRKSDDDVDAMLAAPPLDSPYYANTDAPLLPAPAASDDDQAASSGLFGPVGAPDQGMAMAYSDEDEDKPGFFGRLFGGGDDDKSARSPAPTASGSSSGSGGGVYIVDRKGAQLLKFGNSTISSDSLPMPPGTIVRMTKAGDEWSSVQLPSGAEGIIRNKTLRPAEAGEGSLAMFAHLDKPRYPTTARIGQARSASSSIGSSQAPVSAPTPDLPSSSGTSAVAPVTNSLLPPLPTSAVE